MAYDNNAPDCAGCCAHEPSIWNEFVCHIPYTVVSLAIGFAFASVLHVFGEAVAGQSSDPHVLASGFHDLFHVFHFLHIVFAVTGTTVTFFRYSRRIIFGMCVSLLVPTIFCMVSDSVLPMIAGRILGVDMHLHICLFEDTLNIVIFMLAGLGVGFALLHNASSLVVFSYGSHFFHIFCSSLASLFYIVSHGFTDWAHSMGLVFVSLFLAVIIPCTLSDVVVPLYCVGTDRSSDKE